MSRVYRASIVGHVNVNGALIISTLHYQTDVPTAGSEPDPDDVADGVWSTIGSHYLAATAARCTVDRVDVIEMVIPPALASGGSHVVNSAGLLTSTAGELPAALCLGINIHTETRSRSSRGFTHMPPCFDPTYSGGPVAAGTYLTKVQDMATVLDDSFDLGTFDPTHVHPVVYSRKRHRAGDDPFAFRVTTATVNPKWRYVRSRDTSP